MTNQQVGEKFLKGEKGKSLNMESTGDKLFSYNMVIAQWVDNRMVFNTTKYSRTTSKQTSWIKSYADMATTEYVPFNTHDLRPYI